jgi:hypothetical protein
LLGLAYVFAAVELPEEALWALRRLRRPLPDVHWFDPVDGGDVLAPLRRSWFEEWGCVPLAKASLDEAGIERFDQELQKIRLPAVTFSIPRLTFLLNPEPIRICARIDVSPGLAALVSACEAAALAAGEEVHLFEPLIPLASCYGATREELTAYSAEVEPFAPIDVRCDRFVMLSKASGREAGSVQVRLKVDYEYMLG